MRSLYAVFTAVIITALPLGIAAKPATAQLFTMESAAPRPILMHDRSILRDFIIEHRFRQCGQNETSGLERCGLPSAVITRYAPGSFLPQDVHDEVVPAGVVVQLAPAPHGAAYVYAGDNVYLMDVLSRQILDVVSLTE